MRTNNDRTSPLLKEMIRVARQCGEWMSRADIEHVDRREKTSGKDIVTECDLQIQKHAVAELSRAFPNAGFIGEEDTVFASPGAGLTFIIDPIDGTSNFVHRFGHSCTSIACVKEREPIAAVVFNVFSNELFCAEKGAGAFLNERPIRVSEASLAESLVLFGTSPYNSNTTAATFSAVQSIFPRCQDVRRSGSAALDLCYVAAGRAGMYFEYELSLWDYAGGALIVSEAGGRCLTLAGEGLCFDTPGKSSCIAGNVNIIQESGLIRSSRQFI